MAPAAEKALNAPMADLDGRAAISGSMKMEEVVAMGLRMWDDGLIQKVEMELETSGARAI
jgi:hypothetical protein